jgi:hypothetical protein
LWWSRIWTRRRRLHGTSGEAEIQEQLRDDRRTGQRKEDLVLERRTAFYDGAVPPQEVVHEQRAAVVVVAEPAPRSRACGAGTHGGLRDWTCNGSRQRQKLGRDREHVGRADAPGDLDGALELVLHDPQRCADRPERARA